MKAILSARRAKFYRLVHQASEQSSQWLVDVLKDKTRNGGYFTAVARLACLRVLVCREYGIESPSGLPYPQRKKAVRKALGI
jgi:predicted DNA-binding ribbon-helix-helix protein